MSKNFAYSLVATAPSPASSGTSLVVTTGGGVLFPAVPFQATIWPANSQPTTTNAEIVTVTTVSTDTLTIVRAQESTSARSVIIGDQIAATLTASNVPTSPILINGAATDNDYVLRASQDFLALDHYENGLSSTTEIPTTSTLEVVVPYSSSIIIPSTQLFNPYKFSVFRNASLTATTDVAIVFDSKNFDTGNNISLTTGLFTAPIAGFYQIQACVATSSTVSTFYMALIQKNGSLWKYGEAGGLAAPQSPVADLMQLAAGDTIGIAVHAGSSPVLNVNNNFTYFSGFLVSLT